MLLFDSLKHWHTQEFHTCSALFANNSNPLLPFFVSLFWVKIQKEMEPPIVTVIYWVLGSLTCSLLAASSLKLSLSTPSALGPRG